MSRGLGSKERAILAALEAKDGRVSTRTLIEAVGTQGFYRSLNSLLKKGLISWIKEHGGPNCPSGLVSVTRKNILLVDIDSTIANLALMKISAYHKALGHNVFLHRGLTIPRTLEKPEMVYISCIFVKNRAAARRLAKQFPESEVHLGGCGINLSTTLPEDIEHLMPDYDLYPECDYSLGYCSRGCLRNCGFCIAPRKEGKVHPVADIYEFYNPKFKKMVLLDNNILALPDHFRKIAKQIISEKIRAEFKQGLDIRLVDDKNAKLLKQMRILEPKFSWDDVNDEYMVMRGIEILRRNGINRSMFYVLIGYSSTFQQDLYRLNRLRDLGQRAFVMIYDREILKDPRYASMRSWANPQKFFPKCTYEEFVANSA
jgi:hypothetical protein